MALGAFAVTASLHQFPSTADGRAFRTNGGVMQEELEVPYELKKYQRTPEMVAPPELKAVNPLGTAPAITDEGLNLAESGAIVGT